MTLLTTTETIPPETDRDGVVRVGKTRVTYVIGYYLRRQLEVEAYLSGRRQRASETRRQNELRFDPIGIRGRLLARQVL